jgi:hypothetical protein
LGSSSPSDFSTHTRPNEVEFIPENPLGNKIKPFDQSTLRSRSDPINPEKLCLKKAENDDEIFPITSFQGFFCYRVARMTLAREFFKKPFKRPFRHTRRNVEITGAQLLCRFSNGWLKVLAYLPNS